MHGDAALERLDAGEAPDLLISDLSMPGMDGLCLSWGHAIFSNASLAAPWRFIRKEVSTNCLVRR
jgi:DNA-binding NarL/FixJ family response regulator